MGDHITSERLRSIPADDVTRAYLMQAAEALDAKDQQIDWYKRLREAQRDHTVREVAAAEAARNRAQVAQSSAENREAAALEEVERLSAEIARLQADPTPPASSTEGEAL